jgi:tetratricopeptide (TPR) repeat protein
MIARDIFALALQNHRAGNLAAAEQLYRQVLQADPDHADSHHLLGVLSYQAGRVNQAIDLIGRAISLNPRVASYYSNLGLAKEAAGQSAEAVAHYRDALLLDPNHPEAHSNLAKALLHQDKLEEVVQHCRQALQIRPTFLEALLTLGAALQRQGKLHEAFAIWLDALRIDPDCALAHFNLGLAWDRNDQIDEAIHSYRKALRLDPNLADAWNNLGAALMRQDKVEEAIGCYQEALKLAPNYHETHHNLAVALERQNKLDLAIRCYREALRLQPTLVDACNNLGSVLALEGQIDEGISWLDQALQLQPDYALAHWNRSLLWLLRGDFKRGWPEYEWRARKGATGGLPPVFFEGLDGRHWQQDASGTPFQRRQFREPLWDGSPLIGRTILLHTEQGLGDTIQFIRYASLVKDRGGKVIVECQSALLPLLATASGIDHLAAERSDLPPFDVQAPLLSLPGIFGTELATIPAQVPYLQADANLVQHWRQKLSTLRGFKVGMAWQGRPTFRYDRRRSIPLAHFAPLAGIDGIQLISLQKGPGADQLDLIASKFAVHNLGNDLDESTGAFMDTAAVIMNLDMVICSDSAIAHLAGAMGVPVWVALNMVPDWRWLLEREDSPWYPTMHLFRQTKSGDWNSVFAHIAAELSTLVGRRAQ